MKDALEFILDNLEKQENGEYYFIAGGALSLEEHHIKEIKKAIASPL